MSWTPIAEPVRLNGTLRCARAATILQARTGRARRTRIGPHAGLGLGWAAWARTAGAGFSRWVGWALWHDSACGTVCAELGGVSRRS